MGNTGEANLQDGPADSVEERDSILGELTRLEGATERLGKALDSVSHGVQSDNKEPSEGGSVVKVRLKKLRLQVVRMSEGLDL